MFYRWRPAKVFRYPSPLLLPLKSAPIQAEKQFNARLSYGSLSVLFLIAFRLGVGHEELNSYQRSRRLLLLLFHLLLLFSFPPFYILQTQQRKSFCFQLEVAYLLAFYISSARTAPADNATSCWQPEDGARVRISVRWCSRSFQLAANYLYFWAVPLVSTDYKL